jgi:glycerol-3-phosphate O-acyltransferase/dihydroxyacetone phosphate acyltransferase
VTARDLADSATGLLARTLVRIFFRSVEVTGADHVTATGPLIEVANHQNGLVDGLVLIAASRRYPRFLGKSTLWKIAPLRPFLALAGVVPVYRGSDTVGVLTDAERAEHNGAALARSRDLLAGGGTIGVFPEGISHDLASLQDLRTGAARLALGAAADGVVGVAVLPVGIVYDDKARFRSRVLVRFGPARAVDDRVAEFRHDPHGAVHLLTADIAADLRLVGPDYDSVAAADRFARLAALAADDPGHGLVQQEQIARRLATAAADPTTRPDVVALDGRRRHYEAGLRRAGHDDAGVRLAATAPPFPPARRLLGALPDIVAVPLAGIGIAVHALPYGAIKVIGAVPANRGMQATVKLLGSFGLYNLTYVLLGVLVGRRRGPILGVVTLLGAPVTGWIALRSLEEAEDLGLAQRAAAAVMRRGTMVAHLAAERVALAEAIHRAAGTAP